MTRSITPGTTSVPLRILFRRAPLVGAASWKDPLVGAVIQRWIVRSAAAGTEVPRGKRG
ncbi:hypothetical protein THTE_0133 [Thermogutta terrifontis]|uniref:Uncharacterized protein n=1 Tax=Thermogutta terrifontis TaxID=1331910 RepID=A0A286R9T9_9BACT|nr:hypothetical protein THTE_0133 [Thermogutta terrifontis]